MLALGAVAAHGLFLIPDSWLKPTLPQLLVPFAGGYRPLWTGLGILALYGAAGLSLTYYARRRIGHRRWRAAHRFIPIAWALSATHVIGAGTDVVSLWLEAILAATIAATVVLLVQRGLAGRTQPAGREPARAGGGSAGTEPAPSGPAPDRREVPAGAPPPERKYAGDLGLFR